MADAFLKQYGGSGADSSDCTAKKSQVLAGVTAITSDSNDEAEAGTMPERGALNRTLAAGQSVTLPEGHYTGGTVSAQSLASQTAATGTSADLRVGKNAYANGRLFSGAIEDMSGGKVTLSETQQTILCSGKYMTENIVIPGVKAVDMTVPRSSQRGSFKRANNVVRSNIYYIEGNFPSQLSGKYTLFYYLSGGTSYNNGFVGNAGFGSTERGYVFTNMGQGNNDANADQAYVIGANDCIMSTTGFKLPVTPGFSNDTYRVIVVENI